MEDLYRKECYKIRGAAFEVYRNFGNGFLEAVYQEALQNEFEQRCIPFQVQPELKIHYKGICLKQYYRPDFVCFDNIVLELKAVNEITGEHISQVINYLKVTQFKLGLLINFGHHPLIQVKRIIL